MWDDPPAPEWGKRRKERACDGELIEGAAENKGKRKTYNSWRVYSYNEAEYGRTFDKTEQA